MLESLNQMICTCVISCMRQITKRNLIIRLANRLVGYIKVNFGRRNKVKRNNCVSKLWKSVLVDVAFTLA